MPAAVVAITSACGDPYVEPDHAVASFVLPGAHMDLTCEECHGPPPYGYFTWDTNCVSCHEEDRKEQQPGHYYPQGCAGEGCHSDTHFGWDEYGLVHDFLPLEDVHALPCESCHGSPDPSNDDIVPQTGSRDSCAGCHDTLTQADRPVGHYSEDPLLIPADALVGWDCNACHRVYARTLVDWTTTSDHGLVKMPHGTQTGPADGQVAMPPGAWVVACTDCHDEAGSPVYQCTEACHAGIFVEPVLVYHNGLQPVVSDGSCTQGGCHLYGDIRTFEDPAIGLGELP
ncbi:MAG: cytochrome c3 family protein [Myxococcota bacterium]